MKNLLLLFLAISLFSCQEEVVKPDYVLLSGKVNNNNAKLINISNSDFKEAITIAEDGTFADTLNITNNGFYSMRIGREGTSIYLTKGAVINLDVDVKKFDESLSYTGDVSAENNYLKKKFLLSEKTMGVPDMYSLKENEFLAEINKLNDNYTSLLSSTKNISKEFIAKEKKELEYAHVNNIENFQEYYRYFKKDNDFVVSKNYYEEIKDFNYSDLEAYNSSNAYKSLLETHYYRLANVNKGQEGHVESLSYLKLINKNIPDGKEKDEMMTNYLRYGMKADKNLDDVYAIYKKANPSSKNLPKITERYDLLKRLTPGNVSPTFNYENHKGGETSLADLKGKIVYVDVWATWCGPCKREIPFLKELDKEYHGKNIAFVSISIDEKKDYDAWRSMVTEKELGGYQLMADNDWKSKFVADYGIRGIPRFLLIDAEGKIINADAPRPSSTGIRTTINGLL